MGVLTVCPDNPERAQRVSTMAAQNDTLIEDIKKINFEVDQNNKKLAAAIDEILKSVDGPAEFEALKDAAEKTLSEEDKKKFRDEMSTYQHDDAMVKLIGGLASIFGVQFAFRLVATGAGRGLLLMLRIAWAEYRQIGVAAAGQIVRAIPRVVWQLYRHNLPQQIARGRIATGARFLGRFGLMLAISIAVDTVFNAVEKPKLIEMIHEASIARLASAHIKAEAEKTSELVKTILPLALIQLQAMAPGLSPESKKELLKVKDDMIKGLGDKPFKDTTYDHVWKTLRASDEAAHAYLDDDLAEPTAIEKAQAAEAEAVAKAHAEFEANQVIAHNLQATTAATGEKVAIAYKLVD
ncbi:hypothetical protein C8Q80DRAFT_746921 [Daedaleopsis nitida]|nr:hypothetical protein C8Q80DRAFT_746921 [Daedaleopsis nitida]